MNDRVSAKSNGQRLDDYLQNAESPSADFATFWRALLYFVLVLAAILLVAWPGYSTLMGARAQADIEKQQAYLSSFDQRLKQEIYTTGSALKLLSRLMLTDFATVRGERDQDYWLGLHDHLRRVKRTFPDLVNLRLYDERSGLLVSMADSAAIDDTLDRQRATRALAQFQKLSPVELKSSLCVSNIRNVEESKLGQIRHIAYVQIMSPVLNADDEVTGLLVGELKLDHLFVWFDDLLHNTSPDARFEVFDAQGARLFPVNVDGLTREAQTALQPTSVEKSATSVKDVEGGVLIKQTVYPIAAFEGTLIHPYTVSPQGQWTQDVTALGWQTQIFLSKSAWFPKTMLAQPWAQGVLGVLLIGLAIGCWLLARTQRMRAWVASMQVRYADELTDLYENAPVCYQSVGADGYYVRMNQTGLNWLGYTHDEVIGKMHYLEILQPETDAYGNVRDDYLDLLTDPKGIL